MPAQTAPQLTRCTGTGEKAARGAGNTNVCPVCRRGPLALGWTRIEHKPDLVVPPHSPSPVGR